MNKTATSSQTRGCILTIKPKGVTPLTVAPQLSEETLKETMVKPEDIRAIIDSNVCKDIELELKQIIYNMEEQQ